MNKFFFFLMMQILTTSRKILLYHFSLSISLSLSDLSKYHSLPKPSGFKMTLVCVTFAIGKSSVRLLIIIYSIFNSIIFVLWITTNIFIHII